MKYKSIDEKTTGDMKLTGSADQLYSVRRLQLIDGPGAGTRLIEVITAGGLRALFCESRALDLYELHYRGNNIGFASKNGLSSGRVLPLSGDFTSAWPGGLLATCGLRNTGPDCTINGEYHPMHGHIAGKAAEDISIHKDTAAGLITISGRMRESALFGHNLVMERTITIDACGAQINWQDRIINLAAEPEPVLLLYHFNFGYPFLSPALQLTFPPGEVIPRTKVAQEGLANFDQMQQPEDGYAEQVFFHYPLQADEKAVENIVQVKLYNPELDITARLSYDAIHLPVLSQWKSMKTGDYALGIEPGTSCLRGREEELAHDYQFVLPGYSSWQIPITLSFA